MKSTHLTKTFHTIGTASLLFMSGCATVFMRLQSNSHPEQVFPATTFDAGFFWDAAVKGEPLFARLNSDQKNGPVARLAYGVGSIIDLPFSIAFDTLLLPLDLLRPKKEDKDAKREPDSPRE